MGQKAEDERGPGRLARLRRWWRGFFTEPLRRADDEARAYLAGSDARRVDRKVLTVLLTTALVLTLQRYLCMTDEVGRTVRLVRGLGLEGLAGTLHTHLLPPGHQLERLTWWAVGCFVLYFVVPALLVRLVFRERLADYGAKLGGAWADAWVYLVMLAVVGPLVLAASRDPHFQETYPFYRPEWGGGLGPGFWRWELLYGLQFVGLEFFFRGFMLHGLKHRLGPYAIPVMVVPYCMIHFGKPLPETLASIVAGLALGFMSLRTRSIVLGAAIHISVALSMDLASLWRQGFLG